MPFDKGNYYAAIRALVTLYGCLPADERERFWYALEDQDTLIDSPHTLDARVIKRLDFFSMFAGSWHHAIQQPNQAEAIQSYLQYEELTQEQANRLLSAWEIIGKVYAEWRTEDERAEDEREGGRADAAQ